MLEDALESAGKPCTAESRDAILRLAEELAGPDGVADLVKSACKKRGVKKLGELTEPQAHTLIKNLKDAVIEKLNKEAGIEQPPFDTK
jgi:hypothetical protein